MSTQTKKLSNSELLEFGSKVHKMQNDDVSLSEIARYFSIHKNTLRCRMKRLRQKLYGSNFVVIF